MKTIDLHADTITKLTHFESLESNRRSVDIKSLKDADRLIQCFSAFVPTQFYPKAFKDVLTWKTYKSIAKKFNAAAGSFSSDVRKIECFSDIEACITDGKIGMMLTIEDGGVIGHDIGKLDEAYNDGVRLITLTWNGENEIGYPNSDNNAVMLRELKPFGIECIERMNELGIAIDVSHLSDGGFKSVAKHSKKPFTASHSNARAITDHRRNLTDEMIKTIAEHGGVIGLNLCGKFLTDDGNISRVRDLVRHTMHIYSVGGEDVLALGSDFDGIGGKLEIKTPSDTYKLFDALKKAGLPQSAIEKMAYKNSLRFFKDVM